jgi:hypothetical protein
VAPSLTCAQHADRIASARCPGCTRPICSECTIKIEGINVCTACLKARASTEKSRARAGAAGEGIRSAAGAAVGFLALTAVFYLYGLLLNSTV